MHACTHARTHASARTQLQTGNLLTSDLPWPTGGFSSSSIGGRARYVSSKSPLKSRRPPFASRTGGSVALCTSEASSQRETDNEFAAYITNKHVKQMLSRDLLKPFYIGHQVERSRVQPACDSGRNALVALPIGACNHDDSSYDCPLPFDT